MLLLDGEYLLDHPPRRRVAVAEPPRDLLVGGDRHPLGDEILLDHVEEAVPLDVLGVAAGDESRRVEVGCSLKLGDALGDHVRMTLLLVCVLEELGGDGAGVEALGHVVVPLVAEHADELCCEDFVQH